MPTDYWLEGADVAETTYSQPALDTVFDYHSLLTDRDADMLEPEADHRAHAVVELGIRDLKAGGLAHVPSGKFNPNAASVALAVLAHNLGCWTLKEAGASCDNPR